MNMNKWYFQKENITRIMKEYLGFEDDYILNNLKEVYDVITRVYSIIDDYKDYEKNVEFIMQKDYEDGRASDNYYNINLISDYSGIYVYIVMN